MAFTLNAIRVNVNDGIHVTQKYFINYAMKYRKIIF